MSFGLLVMFVNVVLGAYFMPSCFSRLLFSLIAFIGLLLALLEFDDISATPLLQPLFSLRPSPAGEQDEEGHIFHTVYHDSHQPAWDHCRALPPILPPTACLIS